MSRKYQPKHLAQVPTSTSGAMMAAKRTLTALTLTAMVGSQALAPIAAIAENLEADEQQPEAPGTSEVTVDTSFSTATQRLIQAAEGKSR